MSPADTTNPRDPRAPGPALTASGGFVRSGKVRDLFEVGERLLLVASDRLSAFDVVLPTPIPDKGRVLTGLSRFWFAQTAPPIPPPLLRSRPRPPPPPGGARAGRGAPCRPAAASCAPARAPPPPPTLRAGRAAAPRPGGPFPEQWFGDDVGRL